MWTRIVRSGVLLLAALLLAGCAGTIQRESNAGAHRVEGVSYTGVDIVLSDTARRQQADSPQFSVRELGDYVRRRLEGRDLLNPQGSHRVEVVIESFRVRSMAAAVILGVLAGADQIEGHVRVYDARGRQVHGYKVNATYALGGAAGGQDSMRMGWLYDKFSELAVAELEGTTPKEAIAKGGAARAASGPPAPAVAITPPSSGPAVAIGTPPPARTPQARPATSAPAAAAPAPTARYLDSGFAPICDINAIPLLGDRGRKGYQEWLARPTPRAFAISPKGTWQATWGRTQDLTLPADAAERALVLCERTAGMPCKLYAVNGAVVWTKDPH